MRTITSSSRPMTSPLLPSTGRSTIDVRNSIHTLRLARGPEVHHNPEPSPLAPGCGLRALPDQIPPDELEQHRPLEVGVGLLAEAVPFVLGGQIPDRHAVALDRGRDLIR